MLVRKTKLSSLIVIFLTFILFIGCGKLDRTPYTGDPALPIFELIPSDYCKKDAEGKFPEDEKITIGDTDEYVWAEGGGCIFRNIIEAWGVLHNHDYLKWNKVDEIKVLIDEPPSKTSHFYEITYVVNHPMKTVSWIMQWYHTVAFGTKNEPLSIYVNYKRVAGGQKHVRYWEGTIYLEEIEGAVAFAMRNQIDADDTTAEDSGETIKQILNKIRKGSAVTIP